MISKEGVKRILGYGEKLELLVGVYDKDEGDHKEGDEKVVVIHFTPSSLAELPELFEKLATYFSSAGSGSIVSEKFQDQAADIIHYATKKMHPKMSDDDIKKLFGLDGLATAIETVVNVNDFFTRLKDLTDKLSATSEEAKKAAKISNKN